jgi:hypothetical protein
MFFAKAVSNQAGRFSFTRAPSANMGIGSLSKDQRPDLLQVDVVALDDLVCRGLAPMPTVMKIDVEGWELEVLEGAQAILRDHPPRLILFEADCDERGEIRSQELPLLLDKAGYSYRRIGAFHSKADFVANHVAQ